MKKPVNTKFVPQSTLSEKKPRIAPKKRAKDPAMFDPSEYGAGKNPMQCGETRKGVQPDWVVARYGSNKGEVT